MVRALNADQPFDAFTIEQMAGDLLPNRTEDQLLATAFHRNTMNNDEGGTDDEEWRAAAVIDRVNTTSTVWMGLTMACAQCHTHKYDPILHTDYFGLYAFFNQTADSDRADEAPVHPFASPAKISELQRLREQQAAAESTFAAAQSDAESRQLAWVAGIRDSAAATLAPDEQIDVRVEDQVARRGGAELAPGPSTSRGIRVTAEAFAEVINPQRGNFERDQAFSAAAWFKPASDRNHAFLSRMDRHNGYRGWNLEAQDNRLAVQIVHRWGDNVLKVITRDPVFANGRWTHVAMTYDGSSNAAGVRLWINGEDVPLRIDRDTLSETIRTDVPLLLGRQHQGTASDGVVAGVRVASGIWSQSDVEARLALDVHTLVESNRELEPGLALIVADAFLRSDVALASAAASRREIQTAMANLESELPMVPIMQRLPDNALRVTHLFQGGSFLAPGQVVEPHTPGVLHDFANDWPRDRLGLAYWLVDDANPLTPRVQVNRVWARLMGQGLVTTSEDFGLQGAYPSHPELLDWLAVHFRDDLDWSMKGLIRHIVTSRAYRQSSRLTPERFAADPVNALISRGPRFRLPAEQIRDQALAVSGLLVDEIGGPPVLPHLPPGQLAAAFDGLILESSTGESLYRRGLYTLWRRTNHYESFAAFDAPSREVCVVSRDRSNTPLQALVTLNDPVYVEAAQQFARELIAAHERLPDRIDAAYRTALARPPSDFERETLLTLYESAAARFRAEPANAQRFATDPRGPLPDGVAVVDAAAMTVLCNVILNLDEFLTKS